ncbi:MAG: hypothetical protein ABI024_12925 [Vicinamibacterales bacterium]
MGPDQIWRRKSDDEVIAAVASLADYTDEGQAIIVAEARSRGLNIEPILLAKTLSSTQTNNGEVSLESDLWLAVSQQIPADIVGERVRSVFNGACPQCAGPGPIALHTSHRVVSALFVTSWKTHTALACKTCGNKARFRDGLVSLALGWWGLVGLVMTPVQVVRNISSFWFESRANQPSQALENLVRREMAQALVIAQRSEEEPR